MSTWKPNTHDLELIAELGNARMPTAAIAAALGIDEAEFAAWANRLAAVRGMNIEEPPMPIMGSWHRELPVRIAAERLIEQ